MRRRCLTCRAIITADTPDEASDKGLCQPCWSHTPEALKHHASIRLEPMDVIHIGAMMEAAYATRKEYNDDCV